MVNQPPETPLLFAPMDGEENVELTGVELKWQTSQDPDGDEVSYNVYLGQQNPPQTQVASLAETKYMPDETLKPNTEYFWQVFANDGKGNESAGNVATFNTRPPNNAELLIGKWQLESAKDDNEEPVELTDCEKQSTYEFSNGGIFTIKLVYSNSADDGCNSGVHALGYSVLSSTVIRISDNGQEDELEFTVSETELIFEVAVKSSTTIGTFTRIP